MCIKNVKTSENFKWDVLRRNRFLVRFPKEINICEWWIEKVTKHPILFDNKSSKKNLTKAVSLIYCSSLEEYKYIIHFKTHILLFSITQSSYC